MRKVNYAKLTVTLLTTLWISGCKGLPGQPDVDFCGVFGPLDAECVPADDDKEPYLLRTPDMLGYQCLSPEHFADVKRFYQKVIKRLERCESKGN